MTARTPVERGAEAMASPVHAPMTDHNPRDGSCVSCPWPLSEAGTPEEIARAVFESIDREGLAKVLEDHRHDYDRDCGEDFGCICEQVENYDTADAPGVGEHQADAILAYLLGTGEGGAE